MRRGKRREPFQSRLMTIKLLSVSMLQVVNLNGHQPRAISIIEKANSKNGKATSQIRKG
jgi:hypothetical protein